VRVLILDNYDSFTYNLYQIVGEILSDDSTIENFSVVVKRNDEIKLSDAIAFAPDRIIISPGPGSPSNKQYFGVCSDVIVNLGKTVPLLGVCLGMQGIAHCFGGKIAPADVPMHGKVSQIRHDKIGIFKNIPQNLEIMRYHSLIVQPESLPECLSITSTSCENSDADSSFSQSVSAGEEIMGIRHKEYPMEGIQFHPESFATEGGSALLSNFLHSGVSV